MQLRKEVPIIIQVLSCIPMIILAVITYAYSSNTLLTKSEDYINELTASEGCALSALIEAKTYQVEILAGEERVVNLLSYDEKAKYMDEAKAYLKEALVNEDDCEIVILNKKGKVVATATALEDRISLRDKMSFEEVLAGKTSYSDMLVSYLDEDKVINITVPVTNKRGEVIGAVCKVISNEAFCELVQDVKIGRTGYAFILNEEGYMITHPDEKIQGSVFEASDVRALLKDQAKGTEKQGNYLYNNGSNKKYVSYFIVPDIEWIICMTQSINEMKKEAITESTIIFFVLIVLVFVCFYVGCKLSKRIVGPIDLLMDAMEKNQDGRPEYLCTYDGKDEFGALAATYNEMIKRLGDSDQHINVISKELENTRKELEDNYWALEKSQEALEITEERYKSTLEAIDEGIWEYNLITQEFVATQNLNNILGMEIEEKNIITIIEEIMEKQYVQPFVSKIQRCILGETRDFTQEIPVTVLGNKKWLLCKGHAVNGEGGRNKKLIGILTDITDNKQNEEQVRRLSYFDGLTGCLNKATFVESLDAWLSAKDFRQNSVLLFIDLDNFKRINDTLGHDIGDKILNDVGTMLRNDLPQEAVVGRFGGDEFVVFCPNMNDMDSVHELIYDVLNHFRHKMEFGKVKVHVTCSIGVAICPVDGEDSAMLLKNADTAMYKAKNEGKNSYSFYTPSMTEQLDRRLLIEEALRDAIGKESFKLQYQPIVDAKTKKTIGCEALIRMVDSELGFISPGEFIPIAEETDLIIETGDWVLENALCALKAYHDKGFDDFCMNINVSSMQIKEANFLEKLKGKIEKTKVPTEFIKLEVTESVLMENVKESIKLFNEVKAMGIKIALDDFGTGYSSLNYLRNIPLDVLKIDKSFVDEITTSKVLSEIVDSIINMAHALNITVVAEGVEHCNQYELLKEKGCDLIQGYYFSRPLDQKELEGRLKNEKW